MSHPRPIIEPVAMPTTRFGSVASAAFLSEYQPMPRHMAQMPAAVKIQSQTFARLVQGQIRETVGPRDGDDPLRHYLSVVADKTGSLIATSARFGARVSGADPETEHVLTEFGEEIGTAFQLSDDIIDVASDGEDLGKTPGTDLREGVPTLPTLMAKQAAGAGDERLLELLPAAIDCETQIQ